MARGPRPFGERRCAAARKRRQAASPNGERLEPSFESLRARRSVGADMTLLGGGDRPLVRCATR